LDLTVVVIVASVEAGFRGRLDVVLGSDDDGLGS
jgi:hypothetical protein